MSTLNTLFDYTNTREFMHRKGANDVAGKKNYVSPRGNMGTRNMHNNRIITLQQTPT